MTRLPTLSEADVRLRLYPSSGRVVKVAEGYWPGAELEAARKSMLSTTSIERRQLTRAEWQLRVGVIGLPCDCSACCPPPSSSWRSIGKRWIPARTRPEGEPDGNR